MHLSSEEERMYVGEYGEPIRKAMEILVAIGDTYDAEKLIKVQKAHIAGISYKTHGDAGIEYLKALNEKNASVRIPTTLNPIGIDRSQRDKIKLPDEWSRKQLKIVEEYEEMGCESTCSCTPYYHSSLPRFGEHIAWAESSAVVFSNSVIGARDNREGGPSALASGLTGLTPLYGLHMDENRLGQVHVRVKSGVNDLHEFGALGSYIGKKIGEKVPVFEGLEKSVPVENLVALGAGLASAGSVALFHAAGLTPEARTLEDAFGHDVATETIDVGKEEIRDAIEELTSASESDVDFVSIGCPHCSLQQIKQVAMMLSGKKVNDGVNLWVYTSTPIRSLAEKLGYLGIIENAGGTVTSDICTIVGCPEALGFKSVATNSSKMAFYSPGSNKLGAWLGSTEQCIDAAVKGKWEA